ncbi:tetratricopeptide repeat protein [Actinoplanes sp. L3-i22]|uniref:tetratricopeptide repeat protein n=1 Tax=Actinoplanes sp. L3-i22 TaxID=2836373 RepID=UPI001C797F54|nr:tetratricopeptide repeat protein [Actinoplanes sp. L3-i22]BCY09849.1 SARP family transcriptional regulator [Actinoplanes sp. L3-i22]
MHEELAGCLRQLRDLTGRSLRELARDSNLSSSSLSRYFSGQAVPPWPAVVALCRVANRDPRPLREIWERAKEGPAPAPAAPVVRNDLPHDITSFTGRREQLRAVLDAAGQGLLVAIDGMGGVGKSALAVHAAHRLTPDFPGGQLYLDLHGFTPGRDRIEPAEALRVLLTALGVPPGRIPDGTAERAALWRSELVPRRAVVLLDNAADEEHVRDLLPGAGPSFIMITSRRRMIGLDGVRPISLDVLPGDEALQLFTESAGGTRPGDAGEVLRRCGNLPLAIRVAAARLRHRPAWTLDTLVERLRDGEPAVSEIFGMSLRQLDPAQRRMFGLLGLAPGADIDVYGAAALAAIPLANARGLLADLVDVHLVQEPAAGRYRMHDLLRQAARAEAGADDPAPAIGRLADYYISCMLVVNTLVGAIRRVPVTEAQPPPARPVLATHDAAVDWKNTEWANLIATFGLATRLRIDPAAAAIAQLAAGGGAGHGSTEQMRQLLADSLPAALRVGSRPVLAWHRYLLGAVQVRVGRPEEAARHLAAARELMAAEGDPDGEALARAQLAELRSSLGDEQGAVEVLRQASAPPPGVAIRVREATILGRSLVRLGRHAEARDVILEVLDLARGLDRQTERVCLDVLGWAALGTGDPRGALDFAEQTLAINRAARNPLFEAGSLTDTAVALRHLGRTAEAARRNGEAVRLLQRTGEPHLTARGLIAYAQACLVMNDPAEAGTWFRTALEIATGHGLDHLMPAVREGLSQVSRPVPGHPGTD